MSNNIHYVFKTREFAISDLGFHLLRSGYCHKTVPFSGIKEVQIERGFEIHNWLVILILGLLFFS